MSKDGPFAEARRKLQIAKEQMMQQAIRQAAPGTIADKLNEFLAGGVIDRIQYHALFFMEPERASYEINLIGALEEEGILCAGNPDVFQEVENAGSKYYFDNHSPLAALRR